jgi:hypothetical protein
MPPLTLRERIILAVFLAVALACQVYAVALAIWQAPAYATLFEGLGTQLSMTTRSFLATYRHWWIATVLITLASVDLLRRRDPPLWYLTITVSVAAVTAFGMHVWMREALFGPMFDLLRKIG